jgi:hypothetical protein
MLPKVEFRLKVATVLLVFSGYIALITTFDYGQDILIVPLVAVLLMPVGERLDRRFKAYRRLTSAAIVLFVIADLAALRSLTPLEAVVALIMFIQVYSLMHVKSTRNYIHLFLMSFFLILAAAVLTPRPEIAVVFVLFLFSLTWGMTLLEMFAAGSAAAGRAAPPPQWRSASGQIVPAGKIRLFDTRLSILIASTVTGVLAVAAVIFVAGPRTEAGVLGSARTPDTPVIGVSSQVVLSGGGLLQATATPVMRVQFPREPGGLFLRPMFWRVTALDAYTGGGWQHRGLLTPGYDGGEKSRLKSDSRRSTLEGIERPGGGWPEVYYEIYLDHPPETAVPLLQLVKQVTPGRENVTAQFHWDYANDFSVVVKTRNENGVYIQALSESIEPTVEQLRSASVDFAAVMVPEDYAQLTFQDMLPESLDLVRQLTQDQPTAIEKILALQQYLNSSRFEYSRAIPILPEDHPVDAFILHERKGHCQLFASALALMVRSLGLPARVVSGYRGGAWDAGDRSYTVTQDMAHLWTEVYFPKSGWVTFDPSPVDREPEPFTLSRISRTYSRYILKARMLWLRNVVSFESRRQGISLRSTAVNVLRFSGESWDALQSADHRLAFGNLVRGPTILFLAGLSAAVFLWLAFKARARPPGMGVLSADQRRAVRLRAQVVRRLKRLGLRPAGQTAEEIADSAARVNLNDREAIPGALGLYNCARFGRRPLASADLAAWMRRIGRLKLANSAEDTFKAG